VIGKETASQYKPHLLPDLVAGKIAEEDLYVRPLPAYKDAGIKLRLGQEAVAADFDKRLIVLKHKEIVRFDGLIIATGGRPRIPEPLLVFEDLMMTLKTVNDARAWIDKLSHVDSVLIVGGDLTSLSFAKALLSLGKKLYFIVDPNSFWPLRSKPEVSHKVAVRLRARGIEVLESTKIRGMTRVSDHCIKVDTSTGSVQAGVVGAFFGLVPDVRFLARSGLHIERGILVDEYLRTRFDGVYAAGDCAQVYHPELKDYWVSIGYGNAERLGRIAALNLAGGSHRADRAPASIFSVEGIEVSTSWWSEF
jgi:NADPH-dependent 2,4-dienoyl-CoA reductase/sulfur reductase-like enzyme